MTVSFAKRDQYSLPVYIIDPENLDTILEQLDDLSQNWARSNGFLGDFGQALVCPDHNGHYKCALLGLGTAS